MKLRSVPSGAGLLAGSVGLRVDVSARTAPFSRHGRRPAQTPVLPARGARHARSSAPCGAGLLAGSVGLRGDVSARTAPFPRHGRRPAQTPVLPARGARHARSSAPCGAGLLAGSVGLRGDVSARTAPLPQAREKTGMVDVSARTAPSPGTGEDRHGRRFCPHSPFSRHGRRPARTPVLPARGARHTRSSGDAFKTKIPLNRRGGPDLICPRQRAGAPGGRHP